MTENTFYYYFSTIPQVLSALIGITTIYVIFSKNVFERKTKLKAQNLFQLIKERTGTYSSLEDEKRKYNYTELIDKMKFHLQNDDLEELQQIIIETNHTTIYTEGMSKLAIALSNLDFSDLEDEFYISTKSQLLLTLKISILLIVLSFLMLLITDFIIHYQLITSTIMVIVLLICTLNFFMYLQLFKLHYMRQSFENDLPNLSEYKELKMHLGVFFIFSRIKFIINKIFS